MGPRILYELSQNLSVLLEGGLRGKEDRRIAVFFCHPLDPLEDKSSYPSETFGVLYMTHISPEPHYRQSGHVLEGDAPGGLRAELRRPPLWVKVRYVFLTASGDLEERMIVLASALQILHDNPAVHIAAKSDAQAKRNAEGAAGGSSSAETRAEDEMRGEDAGEFPLRIIDDVDSWQDLGLSEHRLIVSFEVTCPIPSTTVETVDLIQERDLVLEPDLKESAS